MTKKVDKIPSDSLALNFLPVDFSDVYALEVECEHNISADDLQVSFWTDFPPWVAALYKLRDVLVKFVGLQGTEGGSHEAFVNCVRTGEPYRISSVPAKNPKETVLLLSDKHLDAYLSVHIERNGPKQKISCITLVKFKKKLGHIYFFFIRPFHGPIVKTMLQTAVAKATAEPAKSEAY